MGTFDIAAYILFALITSITPGSNNYILFSYGRAYGLRKSWFLMLGIFFGFSAMLYIAGYGIAWIISSNPMTAVVMKIIGSLWLLYLAYVLSKPMGPSDEKIPLKIGFRAAFLMQFVNVKAWIMAISGASAFMPHTSNMHLNVFLFTIIFGMIGFPCMICWVLMGNLVQRFFSSSRSAKYIGYAMFVMMVFSVVLIWM